MRVVAKERIAEDVVALTLADEAGGRLPDWTPGSHIDLVLPDGTVRQYSLCGDRWDPYRYRIGVLREPAGRGGSAWVHDRLSVGDVVGLGGPRNNFPLVPAERYLFVAGGIGITPLLPMIHQADLLGADWRLLYGGRRPAFASDLSRYGDRVLLRPGRLRRELAGFLDSYAAGTRIYCCGPAPLLDAVSRGCSSLPPYTLRTERFVADTLAAPARSVSFEVELARSGRTVTVGPGGSVLDAVSAAGVDVLSSCRRGVCGTCETTVLGGLPDHRDSVLDEAERAAGNCMFVCVSRSRTSRLVLDL